MHIVRLAAIYMDIRNILLTCCLSLKLSMVCFPVRKPGAFQVFQDPVACWECLEVRDRKDRREKMELKDRLVTKDHGESWNKRERKEKKGREFN